VVFLHTLAIFWPWVLGTLATTLLVSGIDDLIPTLICLWNLVLRKSVRISRQSRESDYERRIAIFVPCWKESGVIANMIRHNLAAIRYSNYDFFLGVYPNDTATVEVVRQLAGTLRNVHVAMCPHAGPTSKADCLNWIFQRMMLFEQEKHVYFDTVVLHDAEDLIHRDALAIINRERTAYAMVQIPVLPLPTPFGEFTHGVYCDDFAEYQTVDMRARQLCRSFIPSAGVGTAFGREILDRLAQERNNQVFNPASLTEDYEIGVYAHNAGYRQLFAPLKKGPADFTATREYFPRRIRTAIRQRTRWVTGIGLQSWARDGWRGSWRSKYWFWRDRKGLLANPLSFFTNILFVIGFVDWMEASIQHRPWTFAVSNPKIIFLCWLTSTLQSVRIGLRMLYTGRIFGLTFAFGVPLRTFHGNLINCCASLRALWQYAHAKWGQQPLVWLKTDHAYPSRAALVPQSRDLGDVLVSGGFLSADKVQELQMELRSDAYFAALLRARGILTDEQLSSAMSLQSGVPFTHVDIKQVRSRVLRTLPAHIEKRHSLMPFCVEDGKLFVAGTRVPGPTVYEELRSFTRLPIEFHFVTEDNYEDLKALLRAVSVVPSVSPADQRYR
jgi:bacteriophage N4 adsorption protein B